MGLNEQTMGGMPLTTGIKPPTPSGVRVTEVRVSNFRSLVNVVLELDDLTVLVGANNAGKTSFLDAMYAAIGAGRKTLGQEDVHVAAAEAVAPQDRVVTVDVRVQPFDADGKPLQTFPQGSYWTSLWGTGLSQDLDFNDFMAFRTTLSWSDVKGDYALERKFLTEWKPAADWLSATVSAGRGQRRTARTCSAALHRCQTRPRGRSAPTGVVLASSDRQPWTDGGGCRRVRASAFPAERRDRLEEFGAAAPQDKSFRHVLSRQRRQRRRGYHASGSPPQRPLQRCRRHLRDHWRTGIPARSARYGNAQPRVTTCLPCFHVLALCAG